MIRSVHDRRRDEIASACLPWITRGAALAAGKVADARAHAAQAISQALVDTPDGRATLSRANRNRSLEASRTRLEELATSLAGPSTRSLDGLIRDAWEASYRECRVYWLNELGSEVCRATSGVTNKQIATVRGLVLGGYDARTRMINVLTPAANRLRALVVSAATPGRSQRDRSGSLRAWEIATTKAITLAIRSAIQTGAFRCDVLAGRDVIRPELLHADPTIEGS